MLTFLFLAAGGCATQNLPPAQAAATATPATPGRETTGGQDAPASSAQPPQEVVQYAPFPPAALADLLSAELASRRGQAEAAARLYLKQARETSSPDISRRAYTLARLSRNQSLSLEIARIWSAIQPPEAEALAAYAAELLNAGEIETALKEQGRLREISFPVNFIESVLAAASSPGIDLEALSVQLEAFREKFPEDWNLTLSQALLDSWLGRTVTGSQAGSAHRKLNSPHSALAYALILENEGNSEMALRILSRKIAADNNVAATLPLLKARLEIAMKTNNEKRKRASIEALLTVRPQDRDGILALAQLQMQAGSNEDARSNLEGLLDSAAPPDGEALYLLGQLDLAADEISDALQDFERVPPGPRFEDAQTAITKVLLNEGSHSAIRSRAAELARLYPDQKLATFTAMLRAYPQDQETAFPLLADALEWLPDNPALLLERAERKLRLGDAEGAEEDFQALRLLIEQFPDNHAAIHALGRTLAMHTEHYAEAEELFRQALQLAPNELKYRGSQAWLQYRRGGDAEAARATLQRLHAREPTPLHAAWLGELQWALGERKAAVATWRAAQKKWPDHDLLRDIIHRLTGRYEA